VQYEPAQGIHDWPYWRAALASAITWGFFRPISDHPASWTYKTVRREGDAWDVHFRFDAPPEALITLTRDGNTLAATGSGTATFTVVGRPAFTATLPFSREIPPPA
jgi:hypothetical protein